jgi:uncharacterized protein YndB with AHSA1/START domain
MRKTEITAEPGMAMITITREFDAPRELVFRAHVDPALLVQWLGPRDLTTVIDRYDVRDGGTWRFVQTDADGQKYGFHGVFHGTPNPDAIVRTFEFEGAPGHVMLETTAFEQRDGGTLLRIVSSFQSVDDRDAMIAADMERGVRDSGDRLDEVLARHQPSAAEAAVNLPDNASSAGPAGVPADVPAQRPAALDRLDALTGQWEMEATFDEGFFGPGSQAVTNRGGRTTFEWEDGRFFLTQRFVVENPAAPNGIAIIGLSEEPDTFTQHYYDSRGVARVYQMSLDGNVWRLLREASGFWQRYAGTISDDGTTITGAWEMSADGQEWKHDFDLNYIKIG